jgi:hypothetical protein
LSSKKLQKSLSSKKIKKNKRKKLNFLLAFSVKVWYTYSMKNKELINRLGNGVEFTAQGEWFVVADTDFENGVVWGVDQDGGEREVSIDSIDDISESLADMVSRDWSPMLNKLSI